VHFTSVAELTRAVRRGPKCDLKKNLGKVISMFQRLDTDRSGSLDEEEWVSNIMDSEDPTLQAWVEIVLSRLESGNLHQPSRAVSGVEAFMSSHRHRQAQNGSGTAAPSRMGRRWAAAVASMTK